MTEQRTIQPAHIRSKVTVSDRALDALAALRTVEKARAGQVVGLIPTAGGVGLVLDTPGPSDRIVRRDGVPILFIAADLERRLRGRILDYGGPEGRQQFSIERQPNANAPAGNGLLSAQEFVATPPLRAVHSAESTEEHRQDDVVEVFEDKRPDGFAFHLRVLATGRLYRFEPARDPNQPRYWCFQLFRCLPSRLVDPNEQPWFGGGGMTWAEVPAAAAAIRADPNGWLANDQHHHLRQWILEENLEFEGDTGSST